MVKKGILLILPNGAAEHVQEDHTHIPPSSEYSQGTSGETINNQSSKEFLAAIAALYTLMSVRPSLHNEFQEVFYSY